MLPDAPHVLIGLVLVLAAASYLAWNWLIRRLAQRESPLPYEARPPVRWNPESILTLLGFVPDKFGSDVRCGVVAFLIAAAPIYALQAVLAQWVPYEHPLLEEIRQNRDQATLLRVATLAVFVAPLIEELLFRVFIQGMLEAFERRSRRRTRKFRWFPRGAAPLVASSLAFSLAHAGQGPAPAPLFFFALVLGYLYHQTHRIVPSITTHACLNAVSLLMLWLAM